MMASKEKPKHDHGAKPITTGTEEKKSALRKATDTLIKEDLDTIKSSIISDYIEPNTKKLAKEVDRKFREFISDTINSVVSLILFGKTDGRTKKGYYNGQQVNYTSYYYGDSDGRSKNEDRRKSNEPINRIKKVIIPEYGNAEKVLSELNHYITLYHCASIGDYYQLVGMATNELDFMYGWMETVFNKDLIIYDSGAGGYVINFPKPIPLD